jgi:signal transduction histidine kinase
MSTPLERAGECSIESYKRKEIMVRETAHAFRNRLTAIGGFSRRMVQLAKSTDLAKGAKMVNKEVQALETQLERFEKYMGI